MHSTLAQKTVPNYIVSICSSRFEKYVIMVLYCILSAIVLTLPHWWCWPLILVLSGAVGVQLIKKQKYACLTTQSDGSVLLVTRCGKVIQAQIQQKTVVYPFLLILHVKHAYQECILLWPDSAKSTALRHLRIWLYWYWPSLPALTKYSKSTIK